MIHVDERDYWFVYLVTFVWLCSLYYRAKQTVWCKEYFKHRDLLLQILLWAPFSSPQNASFTLNSLIRKHQVRAFSWIVILNKVNTNVISTNVCVMCFKSREMNEHLFLPCPFPWILWMVFCFVWGAVGPPPPKSNSQTEEGKIV